MSEVIGIFRGVTEENFMKAYFTEVWMDFWEPRKKSEASGMSQMGDITDPRLEGQEEERMLTVLGKSWDHRFRNSTTAQPMVWAGSEVGPGVY